jgi:hypothetical protein
MACDTDSDDDIGLMFTVLKGRGAIQLPVFVENAGGSHQRNCEGRKNVVASTPLGEVHFHVSPDSASANAEVASFAAHRGCCCLDRMVEECQRD